MKNYLASEVITVKLSSGIEVFALVTAQIFVVSDYGADADGNRGAPMIDVDWVEIAGPVMSEDVEDLTDEEISEGITKILASSYSNDWRWLLI